MTGLKRSYRIVAAWIFAGTILSSAALAQPPAAELDQLVAPSQEVGSGLQLARRQMADTDLLGALGTLERVQVAHPEAVAPRLLYVSLLCRLDDRAGAEVELGQLAGQAIPDDGWAEVTAACGSMPRPRVERRR
jgi:hypothetical protein